MTVDELLREVVRAGHFKRQDAAEEAALRLYLEHVFESNRARGGPFVLLERDADLLQQVKHQGGHASRAEALRAALEHYLRVIAER